MIGYVAKDKDGAVYLHVEKPEYNDVLEGWYSNPEMVEITNKFPEFNNMSYIDEPIKVELSIKRV